MKIARVTIAAVMVFAASASASEDRTAQIASALFENMTITFLCKTAVGEAHYLAARTTAKDELSQLVGSEQATIYVDDMDRKLKADPRSKSIRTEPRKCYQMMSEAKRKIEIEQAKRRD